MPGKATDQREHSRKAARVTPQAILTGAAHRWRRQRPLGLSVRGFALAAAYLLVFLALDSITAIFETAPSISPWYPPPGLTVAVYLTFGLAYAPVTFAAVVLSGLWIWQLEMPVPYLAMLALTITAGYSVAVWILRSRLAIDRQLASLQSFLTFVVVAILAAGVVAGLSVAVFVAGGTIPRADYASAALDFWIGDVIGLITLTPFLLAVGFPLVKGWMQTITKEPPLIPHRPSGFLKSGRREHLGIGFALASVILVLWLAFGSPVAGEINLFYLLFVPCLWIALRYGLQGGALGALAISSGIIVSASLFGFEFATPVEAQILLLSVALVSLFTGALTTERDRLESQREVAQEAYRAVVDHSLQGLCILQHGRVVFANPALSEMFGYTVDELLAMSPGEAMGQLSPEGRAFIQKQKTDRREGRPVSNHYEMQVDTRHGERRWTEQFVTPIQYHGQPALQIALLDVTERRNAQAQRETALEALKRSQRQLETLSRRLVKAQEMERRALARELHDEVGQILTVIKLNLQTLHRGTLAVDARRAAEASLSAVDGAINRVRQLSWTLRPSLLDNLGLVPALRAFVDQQAQHAPFDVSFSADRRQTRVPEALANAYFRITQEAMTNVMRHANASHVSVTLRVDDNTLVLVVRDDGVGFDLDGTLEEIDAERSLGLIGMRERAHLIGGTFEIRSAPEQGTEITVRTPLSPS